jgi:hypothetical protein
MEIVENAGLKHYTDRHASEMESRYDPSNIDLSVMYNMNYYDMQALFPFIQATIMTGKYWGFGYEGYLKVIDMFKILKFPEVDHIDEIPFMSGNESDLELLSIRGHLRKADHEGKSVFFISENVAAHLQKK